MTIRELLQENFTTAKSGRFLRTGIVIFAGSILNNVILGSITPVRALTNELEASDNYQENLQVLKLSTSYRKSANILSSSPSLNEPFLLAQSKCIQKYVDNPNKTFSICYPIESHEIITTADHVTPASGNEYQQMTSTEDSSTFKLKQQHDPFSSPIQYQQITSTDNSPPIEPTNLYTQQNVSLLSQSQGIETTHELIQRYHTPKKLNPKPKKSAIR